MTDHVPQGLGEFMKFIIVVAMFHVIMLIINYIQYWRKNKKIRNVKECALNIVRGEGLRVRAWVGQVMPILTADAEDAKYFYPTEDQILQAIPEVHARMRALGYIRTAYRHRTRDCANYARRMMVEMDDVLLKQLPNVPTGCGLPVGTFAYVKTNKTRHEVMYVMYAKDKALHFEIFPEEKYLAPMQLTSAEMASGKRIY
jgi:cbb3-type cytochrome oxidase subunit 3